MNITFKSMTKLNKSVLHFTGNESIGNQDSSPTGQFTDTHFEDSSPTEFKTVGHPNYRQEPTRTDKRHFIYYFTNLQLEKLFYRFLDIQYLPKIELWSRYIPNNEPTQ